MRFNPDMIQDFFDCLTLQVRINHFENQQPGTKINPELVEQLAKSAKKYQGAVLLPLLPLVQGSLADDQFEQANRNFARLMADRRQVELQALEAIAPLIRDAIKCIKTSEGGKVWGVQEDAEKYLTDPDAP